MNDFFKRISKPAKQGVKLGKGIAAVSTRHKDQSTSKIALSVGQGVGIILLPVLVLLIDPLLNFLSKSKKRLFILGVTTGLTVGGFLGTLAANVIFTDLPSSFSGLIGMAAGVFISTATFMLVPFIHQKLKEFRSRHHKKAKVEVEEELITKKIARRLNIGLEAGAMFGAAIGTSFAAIHPVLGVAGAAVGTVIAAPIGALVFTLAPSLIKKLKGQRDFTFHPELPHFKSGMGIGSLFGAAAGLMIGTIFFPGIGSVIGGILGASIGGLAGGTAAAFIPAIVNRFKADKLTLSQQQSITRQLVDVLNCMKVTVPVGSAIGAVLGTFVFPGLGTIVGAAIGTLISGVLGAMTPVSISLFKKIFPAIPEQHDASLVTAIRQHKAGISLGIAIGGVLGGILGTFLFPGIGTSIGALIGSGIGSILSVTGALVIPKIVDYFKNHNTSIKQENTGVLPSSHQMINEALDIELDDLSLTNKHSTQISFESTDEQQLPARASSGLIKSGIFPAALMKGERRLPQAAVTFSLLS